MERSSEQKTLSFGKGMTNVPSDLLSEDNELLESVGFIYRDGEMKPIQKPVQIGTAESTLMFVHKQADYENIIGYKDNTIYWYTKGDDGKISEEKGTFSIGSEVIDINSVGNTLICATENGFHYFLFKAGTYKDLGTDLPKPSVEFSSLPTNTELGDRTMCALAEMITEETKRIYYNNDGTISKIDEWAAGTGACKYHTYTFSTDKTKKDSAQEAIQGHVSAYIAKIKEKNHFCFPFFLRYALRLFDGTYARISNPIAYFPTVNRNCRYVPVVYKDEKWQEADCETATTYFMCKLMYTTALKFKATIDGDIDNWSDIVKEVVVFASDDVMPFYLEKDWSFKNALAVQGEYYYNVIENDATGYTSSNCKWSFNQTAEAGVSERPKDVIVPTWKSDQEIIDEMVTKSQFYKLFEVEITESKYINTQDFVQCPIKDNVVTNLTSQEQLSKDDYYGWTSLSADKMFSYNKRINIFSIKRHPFKGFNYFCGPIVQTSGNKRRYFTFKCYVHIVSSLMDRWVESDEFSVVPELTASWLYYPDPNATEMIISNPSTDTFRHVTLTQHKMLNGAYSFEYLPFPARDKTSLGYDETPRPGTLEGYELLDSNIYTSVVNNPFVFEASGDNEVGTGKILGITANTQAVSQGQFGQYPLIVFTNEGTYGMSVSTEGLYSAIHPISRDVSYDNSPFVPTDSLVYFASKKGLMAATGGAVDCMSDQLRGRLNNHADDFSIIAKEGLPDFLKDCFIVYDYRDSMLRIFGSEKAYQFIYNIADKTFGIDNSGITAKAVVNDYPDNLIQDTDGKVYSLTSKPDINEDTNTYSGTIVTRPLKLGGSMNLKSLRKIKNLLYTDDGKLALEIWGSNDCKHWCKLTSLKGKPWAYFTFKYTLKDFKANDSFAGAVVGIQGRRELK